MIHKFCIIRMFFLDVSSYQTQEIFTDLKRGLVANFYDECI